MSLEFHNFFYFLFFLLFIFLSALDDPARIWNYSTYYIPIGKRYQHSANIYSISAHTSDWSKSIQFFIIYWKLSVSCVVAILYIFAWRPTHKSTWRKVGHFHLRQVWCRVIFLRYHFLNLFINERHVVGSSALLAQLIGWIL